MPRDDVASGRSERVTSRDDAERSMIAKLKLRCGAQFTSKLEGIMVNIHKNAFETAEKYGMPGNYVAGANIAGFLKVAESTMAQGIL